MRALVRSRLVGVACLACGVGACSLVTPLDGLTTGDVAGADGGVETAGPDGAPLTLGEGSILGASDGGALVGLDAQTGALDSGAPLDAAHGEGGAPSPFANLVQIYVKSILTTNTVVTTQTADAGAPIVWLDGFFGQHDFATEAEINVLSPASGLVGLPNGASFPGNGVTIPNVQLAWSDGTNDENSVILQNDVDDAGTASSLTFDVPPATYDQLQIYVTGTHGSNGLASNLAVTLSYSDHTTSAGSVVVYAWDTDVGSLDAGAGEHVLVSGIAPIDSATSLVATGFTASIFAIDLNPTPSKSLVNVALLDTGGDPSQLAFETVIFYGATAW